MSASDGWTLVGHPLAERHEHLSGGVAPLVPSPGAPHPSSLGSLECFHARLRETHDANARDAAAGSWTVQNPLDPRVRRSWQRTLDTLQNRKDQIRGLALTSDARVEACVLFRDLSQRGQREIVAFGGAAAPGDGTGEARAMLEIVVRAACQAGSLRVTVPRISDSEIPWADLESMGFERGRTYTRFAVLASSGIP